MLNDLEQWGSSRSKEGSKYPMQGTGFTGRLANFSARRPWRMLILWLVVIVVAGGLAATLLGGALTQEAETHASLEAFDAEDLINERFYNGEDPALEEFVIVSSNDYAVESPEFEAVVNELAAEIRALDSIVAGVTTYYESDTPALVSRDGHQTMLSVTFKGEQADAIEDAGPFLDLISEETAPAPGFEVLTLGNASANEEFARVAEETLQRGELIGVGIGLIILLVVFGALVAAGLPIIVAIAGIFATMGVTAIVGQVLDLNFFITNMIFMIGLAVGIDYVLFVVARYREERERGREKIEAITRAGDTSSRAVFFSGLTVVTALMGMLIIPDDIFFSLGLGAVLVVIVAVLMNLTLVPAVLSLLGDRINKGRLPLIGYRRGRDKEQHGFWAAISHAVMRRPLVYAVATGSLLLALGAVTFTMDLGSSGIGSLPDDSPTYRAYQSLKTDFRGEDLEPIQIVVNTPNAGDAEVQAAVTELTMQLETDEFFGPAMVSVAPNNDLILVEAAMTADAQSNEAVDALSRVRDQYVPQSFAGTDSEVLVGGSTAFVTDSTSMLMDYMPIVFGVVLTITFFLLLIAFRSIVIPIKAILLNLLSVFAAYGLLTLVFQHGVGADLFGFKQVDRIDNWIPLFLFAILFGLSMDYHIFLLSRIKENYDRTGQNNQAVADGVASTAAIITGAALIMVAVFGGFALGELAMFQQMGFGLAAAVVIDATIIRSVLVPASMELLGKRNWYLPKWLEWLPHVSVEGSHDVPEPRQAPAASPITAD